MLISRIKKSFELPAGDRRIAARMTLGFVGAVLCLTLALAGTSIGLTGAFVAAQPSPSGSSPSGPQPPEGVAIQFLNPSAAYRPVTQTQEPPEPNPDDPTQPGDTPKISDKFDGTDEAYHVVTAVNEPPSTALIELYYTPDGESEITLGEMTPVPGSPDTYEFFWNVDDDLDAYFGLLTVRMYQQTPGGFEEVAADEERVRLQHKEGQFIDEPPIAKAETVELLWPSMNGPLGFYKPAGADAVWRTVVEGIASPSLTPPPDPMNPNTDTPSTGADQVRIFYTTTPMGAEPEYKLCVSAGTSTGGPNGAETFAAVCPLAQGDRPSQVTALAAVAMQNHTRQSGAARYSQEAADVHRIQPYLQRVQDLSIDLVTSTSTDSGLRRHALLGPSSNSACIGYEVRVKDLLDRPVEGVNIDVHMRGPSDQIQFGTDTGTGVVTSGKQKPQKDHSTEAGRNCSSEANTAEQGDHNQPGANDIKHIESTNGTGQSGGSGTTFGEWNFQLWSAAAGDTELTAWIDDEPIATDSQKRDADDDLMGDGEKRDTNFAQWFSQSPSVSIDPAGATAAAGECQRFIVRVRAGNRAVRGANVDVHATGPSNDLDFCNPSDGSPVSAPNGGTGHNAEDAGESAHAGEPPVAQHTEGQTNDAGNLIVGIMSPVAGDTSLTAWYDAGEAPFDNDNQDSGEAAATASTNWLVSTGDAVVSFLNPSGYGDDGGTNVAKTRDVDDAYHLVARVSSLQPVGIEFFYRSGDEALVKIGDATRVGQTDTFEAFWPVDVADGTYTLVARVLGTNITAEQEVTVRNEGDPLDPTLEPFETAEITSPLDGTRAAFVGGALPVRGVTSAGADGVTLYYTKVGSVTTPGADAWTECATTTLPTGSAPQEFALDCELASGDQPALVTGIAALPYNCFQGTCDFGPENGAGDAHRVLGTEANPLLAVEPAEAAAPVDSCFKFVVTLQDQTRQPIPGQNLDAHLVGPGGGGNFCAPEDGSGTPRRAPNDGGHLADGDETDEGYHDEAGTTTRHTEAETNSNGRFVVGIESATLGDSQLIVWLDANDNDVQDSGETTDTSIMHWEDEDACDITGTNGPDELEGSDASETICGFGGNDVIRGGGGDDVIDGGGGDDKLRGNAGSDQLRGGSGRDSVLGGGGSDRLSGGADRDTLKGHAQNDRLRGNRGNDTLRGGRGRDNCGGGPGRDRLRGCESATRSFAARTRPI